MFLSSCMIISYCTSTGPMISCDKQKAAELMEQKRQMSFYAGVNQCTRLKMSAVTLLPVLPPNWKLGVGNSCTNTNPVKQHNVK